MDEGKGRGTGHLAMDMVDGEWKEKRWNIVGTEGVVPLDVEHSAEATRI